MGGVVMKTVTQHTQDVQGVSVRGAHGRGGVHSSHEQRYHVKRRHEHVIQNLEDTNRPHSRAAEQLFTSSLLGKQPTKITTLT